MASQVRGAPVELPEDVHFLIIDELAEDSASLSACSLVSRAWTSVARSHLFRALEIQSTAFESRIGRFVEFAKMCPDARAYLEDLTLGCDLSSSSYTEGPEQLYLSGICNIVNMFRKLQRFTVAGVSLLPNPPNEPAPPLPLVRHIHALSLAGCLFHDEDLTLALDLVRMFASVDELSVGGYWSMDHATASSVTQPSTNRIRHVHYDLLGGPQTKMLSSFLRTCGAIGGSLESLHLTWMSMGEVRAYHDLLADAAPRLRRLELDPVQQFWEQKPPRDYDRWQSLGLTECAQLEELSLHMNYTYLSFQTDGHKCFFATVAAYADILTRYAPSALRRLTLKIPVYLRQGSVDITQKDALWDQMDAAVAAMSTLADVTVEVKALEPLEEASEQALRLGFERVLARVHRKGILHIQFKGTLTIDPFDCPPVPLPPPRS